MKKSMLDFLPGLFVLLTFPTGTYSQITTSEDRSGWTVTTEVVPASLEEVNFWAGGRGAAIGEGYVLHTADGGVTWTIIDAPAIMNGDAFSIPSEDTAYALIYSLQVKKTVDGGITWFTPESSSSTRAEVYTDLDMMNSTNGMMVGFWVSPGGMGGPNARRTTDGESWSNCAEQFNGSLTTVRFQNRLRGFVTSMDNDTWLTSNGAVSFWKINTDTAGPVQDVWFTDQFTGYLILSDDESNPPLRAVLKTIDQGLNWSTIFLDSDGTDSRLFRRIWFQDEMNGYIVGDGGLIARTRDGGISWTTEESGTTNGFIDAYFHDTSNAVLVGQNGTIARKGLVLSTDGDISGNPLNFSFYPNPCKDKAELRMTLNQHCRINVQLIDPRGIAVRQICDGEFSSGEHQVDIDTSGLPEGLYVLSISGDHLHETVKLLVIR